MSEATTASAQPGLRIGQFVRFTPSPESAMGRRMGWRSEPRVGIVTDFLDHYPGVVVVWDLLDQVETCGQGASQTPLADDDPELPALRAAHGDYIRDLLRERARRASFLGMLDSLAASREGRDFAHG